MPVLRFVRPGDAEPGVPSARARRPDSTTVPQHEEWTRHFPVGAWIGTSTLNQDDGAGNLASVDPGVQVAWPALLRHPTQGLQTNGINYSLFANWQPYNREDVQGISAYLDGKPTPVQHKVFWGPAGRTDPVDNATGIEGDWFQRGSGSQTYADALAFAAPIVANFQGHPSVLGYQAGDDITTSHRGQAAMTLARAMQDLDPYGRPVLVVVTPESISAPPGTWALPDADHTKIALFYRYPCGRYANGTDTSEGDFHRSTFAGAPDLGGGGGDWVDTLRQCLVGLPASCKGRFHLILQAHRTTGAGAGVLRYPTDRELRTQFWIAVGEGAKGLWWFTWDGPSESTDVLWYGLGDGHRLSGLRVAGELSSRLSPPIRDRLLRTTRIADAFAVSGGGSSGYPVNYPAAYASTLYDADAHRSYCVVVNRSTSTASITPTSSTLTGSLTNLESGVTTKLGSAVSLPALDGSIWVHNLDKTGLWRGYGPGNRVRAATPTHWYDAAYDSRLPIAAANTTGATLFDKTVSVTIPSGEAVDAASLRVVETTPLGGIDRPQSYRYGVTSMGGANRFMVLPASLSGTTLAFKAPGWWRTGETRTFHAYWNRAGGIAAVENDHLGQTQYWFVSLGTTGDAYQLVVNGTTYATTQAGGDSSTTIGNRLRNAINAGTDAWCTGSGGNLTISPRGTATQQGDTTWTVANTGTTQPAKLAQQGTGYLALGRPGPDWDSTGHMWSILMGFGTDSALAASLASGRLAWGAPTADQLRLLAYKRNGDGTVRGLLTGAFGSLAVNGHNLVLAGTVAGFGGEWTGSYTATVEHKALALPKSDGTGGDGTGLGDTLKGCLVAYVDMTLTCAVAYTPQTIATSAFNTTNNQYVLSVNSGSNFAGSIAPAGEQLTSFYATAGAGPTAIATATDTNGLMNPTAGASGSVQPDAIVGGAANSAAMGVRLQQVDWSGFGSQSVTFRWNGRDLQLLGTSSGATVPQGATVRLRFWYAHAGTADATANGNSLLPSEIVAVLRNADKTPTATAGAVERYASDSLRETMLRSSAAAVDGVRWYQDNAPLYGGVVAWTALGTNGDAYRLTIDGTAYARTQQGGDTAAGIATALAALVNAGTQATATATGNKIVLTPLGSYLTDPATFVVSNAGSTQPGNLPVVRNCAFQRNLLAGTNALVDDHDANYGEGHKLHGLCLRYLRTRDPHLIPLIENQVSYAINIERAAVAQWGTWYAGIAPYWVVPIGVSSDPTDTGVEFGVNGSTTGNSTRNDPFVPLTLTVTAGSNGHVYKIILNGTAFQVTQSGVQSAATIATNLAAQINGGSVATASVAGNAITVTPGASIVATGHFTFDNTGTTVTANLTMRRPYTYVAGDVRASTSPDQMHMVSHGLYAYAWLLRNEAAITANAVLRAAALALLSRMATFETAMIPTAAGTVQNLYDRVNGGSPAATKTVSIPSPYYGAEYGPWQRLDLVGAVSPLPGIFPSSNIAIDTFFTLVWSLTPDNALVLNWTKGRAMDMLTADFGRRDVVVAAGQEAWGRCKGYPKGWLPRSGDGGNTYQFTASRPGDDHWISINSGGNRDSVHGRSAQRLVVLCLLAMLSPAYQLPNRMEGGVETTVPILDGMDDLARTIATFLTEPATSSQVWSQNGYLGNGHGKLIDSAAHGYWTMASELWHWAHLVAAGSATASDYYLVPGE